MKSTKTKAALLFLLLAITLIGLSSFGSANAFSTNNFKYNGKVTGTVYVYDPTDSESPLYGQFEDILMLQTLTDLNSLKGQGSLHGILCQATFFLEYTATRGVDGYTMTGTIVGTNMAKHGMLADMWTGMSIKLTVHFSTNIVSFTIYDTHHTYFVGYENAK